MTNMLVTCGVQPDMQLKGLIFHTGLKVVMLAVFAKYSVVMLDVVMLD